MAQNYVLLERIELNASASSVTFANIPQSGYTDLQIVASARTAFSDLTGGIQLTVNGSTSGYTNRHVYGDGSTAGSYANNTSTSGYVGIITGATATASTFGSASIYCPNYTGSSNKSFSVDIVGENNATTAYAMLNTILWSNTAAINSITLTAANSSTFVQYSTFSLYGLAAVGTTPVIAPKASGGSIIDTDGTYWYHTFLTSGIFTPATNLTCDYLVVGGGAGGGNGIGTSYGSGGGGAGGLRSTVTATGGGGSLETPLSLASNTAYTVTVGAGGNTNTNGTDSVFATITSTGGGRGGNSNANNAQSGGSGGGAGAQLTSANGSSGTTNQGYAGGNNAGNNIDGAGGGGGAGAVGANGSGANSGNGGNGVATSITGTSVTYAGGGGGGGGQTRTGTASGGTGGGGTGGGAGNPGATAPTNGSTNTGGGGGGGGRNTSGALGGSGIVVVRYTVA